MGHRVAGLDVRWAEGGDAIVLHACDLAYGGRRFGPAGIGRSPLYAEQAVTWGAVSLGSTPKWLRVVML